MGATGHRLRLGTTNYKRLDPFYFCLGPLARQEGNKHFLLDRKYIYAYIVYMKVNYIIA